MTVNAGTLAGHVVWPVSAFDVLFLFIDYFWARCFQCPFGPLDGSRGSDSPVPSANPPIPLPATSAPPAAYWRKTWRYCSWRAGLSVAGVAVPVSRRPAVTTPRVNGHLNTGGAACAGETEPAQCESGPHFCCAVLSAGCTRHEQRHQRCSVIHTGIFSLDTVGLRQASGESGPMWQM